MFHTTAIRVPQSVVMDLDSIAGQGKDLAVDCAICGKSFRIASIRFKPRWPDGAIRSADHELGAIALKQELFLCVRKAVSIAIDILRFRRMLAGCSVDENSR